MVEIESFDGQADGYSLTPYVRIYDDGDIALEIARLDDSEDPLLAYQWPSDNEGRESYHNGMETVTKTGIGPVTKIELDDGTEVYDMPVEDDRDHRYGTLRDLAGLDTDTDVAVRITAEDGRYENDTQDDFENLEAPYSPAIVDNALEQAGVPSDSADEIQDLLEDDVLYDHSS